MCDAVSCLPYSKRMKSVGSVLIHLLRWITHPWQEGKWLLNSEQAWAWILATNILPVKGTCFGATRLSVLVSRGPRCDRLPFSCTAQFSVSWFLTPHSQPCCPQVQAPSWLWTCAPPLLLVSPFDGHVTPVSCGWRRLLPSGGVLT